MPIFDLGIENWFVRVSPLEATGVKWGDAPMRLAPLYWGTRPARGSPYWCSQSKNPKLIGHLELQK
ncbi:hypothetical protein [Nostoc sp. DedQUE09]|uniref:hypothetical protein n=1 Tax=Nostoc sp. DedQUE09 TaxID=3075394 RepID=UPI002AD2940C|nr:hypothetical protein [Nostoc sp. DedQUE09]MDZ7953894.1 hypothetical protein [Nostoc sp. DedQUE09]